MCVYRQSKWLILVIALSGCGGLDPTPLAYDRSPFSHAAQVEGNAYCAPLFDAGQFSRLADKIPTRSGQVPTRAMLNLNAAPDDQDIAAIKALESAERTCRQMRAAAGAPTSATEDILAARISRLRYGLYQGDIPYAVYNYGMAQALKSHNRFLLEGEKSAAEGSAVGEGKATRALMLGQFMVLGAALDHYEKTQARAPSWTCTRSTFAGGNAYVDCY